MQSSKKMTDRKRRVHLPEGAAMTALIMTIFRANGRLLRCGDNLTRDLGITAARWKVMGAIHDGPKTVSQIARRFELTRQGVLWVVTALIKEGLVELIDNPDHKRAKFVQFTKLGWRVYEETQRRQIAWVNAIASEFTVDEIRNANEVIERMGRAVVK